MPYYTDNGIGTESETLDNLPTTLGASVNTAVEDAFISNPTKVIYDFAQVQRANRGAKLDKTEAEGRVKAAGVKLTVPESGYSEDALSMLIDRKTDEMKRQSILARAPTGVVPSTTRFAASMLTSILDPINVASAFIPVVGEARYAELIANASGALGRAGVRAGVGALEGAVGAAVVEPINYFGRTQMQDDYHMADSMLNLAMGAAFGGTLHAGGGAVGDKLGVSGFARDQRVKAVDAVEEARLKTLADAPDERISIPGLSEKQAAAIDAIRASEAPHVPAPDSAAARAAEMSPEGRQAATRVAVAQAMDGRIPDVEVLSHADAQANLREFMAGSKAVDAEGAPQVLYHGTDQLGASEFKAGEPIYLTSDANYATGFNVAKEGGQTIPMYASVKNPLVLSKGGEIDGVKYSPEVIARLKAEGYDGVVFAGDSRHPPQTIVFDRSQLKSAIGNSGRFDPKSGSLTDARTVSERQAAPESVAVADFPASRAADERLANQPKPESAAEEALTATTEKLDALIKNLEQRGMSPERIAAIKAELKPFDEQIADSKKLGDAMKAAAVCGIK